MTTGTLSFIDLARAVLEKQSKPLTVEEIWDLAQGAGLLSQLGTTGKTPKATLGARLYTDVKSPDGIFAKFGSRPARFYLRTKEIPEEILQKQVLEAPPTPTKNFGFAEKDLHPLLVRFAHTQFEAHCKTICHEKSAKIGQKHNEWLHPDIVGFSLPTEDWHAALVPLAQRSGALNAKVYSFELKLRIDFSSLRPSFFEAVANSSWAHEAYLVAADIDGDQQLQDELERLSQSFQIGVIQLNLQVPDESQILFPAQERPTLDWETVNRMLCAENEDFIGFVQSVWKSVQTNTAFAGQNFDKVLTPSELTTYLKKFSSSPTLLPTA
jgi:uncharacterized protein